MLSRPIEAVSRIIVAGAQSDINPNTAINKMIVVPNVINAVFRMSFFICNPKISVVSV